MPSNTILLRYLISSYYLHSNFVLLSISSYSSFSFFSFSYYFRCFSRSSAACYCADADSNSFSAGAIFKRNLDSKSGCSPSRRIFDTKEEEE